MAELKDVCTALGIAEDADPVAAISNMKAEIASLKETIASDATKADVATMAKLRSDLSDAQRQLLTLQGETNAQIAKIETERRKERAKAKVETLIAKGRIAPVMRDMAVDLAETMTEEKFDAFVATIPGIDLTERGVATGHELAELEPTPEEIKIAKQLGNWDDAKPNESRLALIRVKAKDKGLTLPAEVG